MAAWADAFSSEIHLWRVSEPLPRRLLGHSLGVKQLCFSTDGSLLASASLDHSIRLWSVSDAKPVRVLRGHWAQSNGVAFSPDGRTLASVAHQDSMKFWDVASGRELCSLPGRHWGESLAFSPDGRWLGISLSPGTGNSFGLKLLRGASMNLH
jgi:WD40 repeat protein